MQHSSTSVNLWDHADRDASRTRIGRNSDGDTVIDRNRDKQLETES